MKQTLNKFVVMLAIFINILLIATVGCSADKTNKEPEKKVEESANSPKDYAASVNGVKIEKNQVDQKLDLIKKRYSDMGTPIAEDQLAKMREKLVTSLVEQELLYQESKAQGISVDQATVASDFENFKKQFKSEEEYKKQMSDLNYSEDMLKSQIEKTKAIQQLLEKNVIPTITVSDEELKVYYDSHPDEFKHAERARARHILVKVDANASEADKAAARKKIESIQEQLKKGGDFAKLATENSDCPSGKNGGDLGFFTRGQMVKPFEDAAFSLKPGKVSDIVETQFGYHIIKLEEIQPASTQKFEEVKEGIQKQLKSGKTRDALVAYVESLKKKGNVEIVKVEEKQNPVVDEQKPPVQN